MTDSSKVNLRQEQAVETRKKLLQSALKLFAENGYDGTNVRSINRSIGMADGLMYHYFPSGKREIMEVLIRENSTGILAKQAEHRADLSNLPLEEVLEQLYHYFDGFFTEYQDAFKLIFRDDEARRIAREMSLDVTLSESRKWFTLLLRNRAEAGEIREIDYDSATEMLVALFLHHFVALLTNFVPVKLNNPQYRKRLIAYQVGLWKNPLP